jgi:cell division protein FtsB
MRQLGCRERRCTGNGRLDWRAMTGIEPSESQPQPSKPPMRSRWRLPASRGGLAWLAVLLIVGTLLAVQFGRQVYANWAIGREAAAIEAQIAEVEAENAQLQAELDYLRSDAYISAEARRLANLGNPGDQVLIIPPGAEAPLPEELSNVPPPKPMLEQWWELFFGPSR